MRTRKPIIEILGLKGGNIDRYFFEWKSMKNVGTQKNDTNFISIRPEIK